MSDDELLEELERLAAREREALHLFLACLAEVDRRRFLEKHGYNSTFDYCVRRLKLSEGEAYRRIQASRAATLRPQLLSAVADGSLTLTAVSKIAPHVRRPDAPEIIARAEGKTTRQIEEMLAPLNPVPERRDIVRTVAVANLNGPPHLLVDFSFRGTQALDAAIKRIQELLSSKFPFGGLDDVLLEVTRDYIERHDPQKGLPGRLAPVKGSSSISAPVRRAVWARDGGRCTYIGTTGTRCLARRFLEMDHVRPRALGGGDTIGNLRLLCRPHNDSERRRLLGEGVG